MAVILDGKALSKKIKTELAERTARMRAETGKAPGLAAVIVGENPASLTYVRSKRRDCDECGFNSATYPLAADVPQSELISLIGRLNADPEVDGILVQLPLPAGFDTHEVIEAISPEKDVDCFCDVNTGLLFTGRPGFLPCTPSGIMEILKEYGIEIRGRNCVVVGRSNIVGKPMAMLLLAADGTVTVCHSRTADLAGVCRGADILVCAVGHRRLITADMVKPGAVVIDVGMNRDENGKLCGDVDFEAVSRVASAITPVPGGVGPMTRAMLMKNTFEAAQRRLKAAGAAGKAGE